MKKLIFSFVFLLVLSSTFASAGWVDDLKERLGFGDPSLSPVMQSVQLGVKNKLTNDMVQGVTVKFREGSATGAIKKTATTNSAGIVVVSLEVGKTYWAEMTKDGFTSEQSNVNIGVVTQMSGVQNKGTRALTPNNLPTREVRIFVKNANNAAVDNAQVKIIKGASGSNVAFTQTTDDGYTGYFKLTIGQYYSVKVTKSGYETKTSQIGSVTATTSQTHTVTLTSGSSSDDDDEDDSGAGGGTTGGSDGGSSGSGSSGLLHCSNYGGAVCPSNTYCDTPPTVNSLDGPCCIGGSQFCLPNAPGSGSSGGGGSSGGSSGLLHCSNYGGAVCPANTYCDTPPTVNSLDGQCCIGGSQFCLPNAPGSGSSGSGGSGSTSCADVDWYPFGYDRSQITEASSTGVGATWYRDECVSSTRVKEYYCSATGTVSSSLVDCGEGYECRTNNNNEGYCSLIGEGSDDSEPTPPENPSEPSSPSATDYPQCGDSTMDLTAINPNPGEGKTRRAIKSVRSGQGYLICASGNAACESIGKACEKVEYYDTSSSTYKTAGNHSCGEGVENYAGDGYIYAAICSGEAPADSNPQCGAAGYVFDPDTEEGRNATHLRSTEGAALCTTGSTACSSIGLECTRILLYENSHWVHAGSAYRCDRPVSSYPSDGLFYAAECAPEEDVPTTGADAGTRLARIIVRNTQGDYLTGASVKIEKGSATVGTFETAGSGGVGPISLETSVSYKLTIEADEYETRTVNSFTVPSGSSSMYIDSFELTPVAGTNTEYCSRWYVFWC